MTADEGRLALCDECQARLAPEPWDTCGRCGAPFYGGQCGLGGCSRCRGQRFRFDSAIALGIYDGDLAEAILRIKRAGQEPLAAALGALLAARRCQGLEALKPDMVVPVPMHWRQRLARKVNCPDVLAARLGRTLGLPVRMRVLRRIRNTLPQKSLPPSKRFANVAGAFGMSGGYDLRGARVLLVDDVLTTGATSSAAAGALKRGGASQVMVAVLGRGIGDTVP